ncbi:MAG: RidA family protein [Alphaproteobacteria bacterium]|nr:RidA family protein [Alphaproteobacteria bacterium]
MNPETNLTQRNLALPLAEAPAFDYLPLSIHNGVAYLAGQLAKVDGVLPDPGKVGQEIDEAEAGRQMQLCALQSLSWLKHYLGSLEKVQKVLHLNAYVACTEDFEFISRIADYASSVFITAFGDENGRHARSVLGMVRLPQNAPVMIDLRVAVRD